MFITTISQNTVLKHLSQREVSSSLVNIRMKFHHECFYVLPIHCSTAIHRMEDVHREVGQRPHAESKALKKMNDTGRAKEVKDKCRGE